MRVTIESKYPGRALSGRWFERIVSTVIARFPTPGEGIDLRFVWVDEDELLDTHGVERTNDQISPGVSVTVETVEYIPDVLFVKGISTEKPAKA